MIFDKNLPDNQIVGAADLETAGVRPFKYIPDASNLDKPENDYVFFRYADALLMKAEALNELGQTSAAIPLINRIRTRAGLTATTASTKEDVRTAIWKERRLELAFEHDRFFDLVRTGQAQAAFAADGKTFVVGKHEVFPLPQKFINEAGGLSSQNNY